MAGDFGADGTVVHTADLNAIFKVVGTASPITASPPTAGASSGYKIQAGRNVVTTNASGHWTFNFPVAFTTGLVMFVAFNDNTNTATLITGDLSGCSRTAAAGYAFLNNVAINAGGVDIGWIAVGW